MIRLPARPALAVVSFSDDERNHAISKMRVKYWIIALSLCLSDRAAANGHAVRLFGEGSTEQAWHLEVAQATLANAVAEVAEQTGIRIHYSTLPDDRLDLICRRRTVAELLACLLAGKADVVLRYASSAHKPARRLVEAWIVPKHPNAATQPAERPNSAEPVENRAEPPQAPRDYQAWAVALADRDASIRVQAVSELAQAEPDDALPLLQSALQDSDVSVRLMAVDNAGRYPQLLQQALDDKDETVRAYAATKLAALRPNIRMID